MDGSRGGSCCGKLWGQAVGAVAEAVGQAVGQVVLAGRVGGPSRWQPRRRRSLPSPVRRLQDLACSISSTAHPSSCWEMTCRPSREFPFSEGRSSGNSRGPHGFCHQSPRLWHRSHHGSCRQGCHGSATALPQPCDIARGPWPVAHGGTATLILAHDSRASHAPGSGLHAPYSLLHATCSTLHAPGSRRLARWPMADGRWSTAGPAAGPPAGQVRSGTVRYGQGWEGRAGDVQIPAHLRHFTPFTCIGDTELFDAIWRSRRARLPPNPPPQSSSILLNPPQSSRRNPPTHFREWKGEWMRPWWLE